MENVDMERLEVNSIEIFIGETLKLRAKAYAGGNEEMIQWSTSDKAVATVKDGLVTGIGEGKAVITALGEDESKVLGGCHVTVTKRRPKEINAAAQAIQEKKAVVPEEKEEVQSIREKSPDSPEEFIRIEEPGCSGIYKFKKTDNRIKGVAFVELINSEKTDIAIPAAICIDGQTYPVTELASKAFENNQRLESVTIGSNVKKIGREAFSGCINLKKITIESTALKSIGENAIKNIDAKTIIKCPKQQIKKYKKLFKGKTGYEKTMKIKKYLLA